MSAFLTSLIERLFRTETIVAAVALGLIAAGRVQTLEEALVTGGTVVSLILGRSAVKTRGHD